MNFPGFWGLLDLLCTKCYPVMSFINIFLFICVLLSSLVEAAWQGSSSGSHILSGQSRTCRDGSEPGAVQRSAGGQGGPLCGPRSPSSPGKIFGYKYRLWLFLVLFLHFVSFLSFSHYYEFIQSLARCLTSDSSFSASRVSEKEKVQLLSLYCMKGHSC